MIDETGVFNNYDNIADDIKKPVNSTFTGFY
jgi:hypothetical protein